MNLSSSNCGRGAEQCPCGSGGSCNKRHLLSVGVFFVCVRNEFKRNPKENCFREITLISLRERLGRHERGLVRLATKIV